MVLAGVAEDELAQTTPQQQLPFEARRTFEESNNELVACAEVLCGGGAGGGATTP